MTYCVGVLLKDGIVFGSDSRTHAGVDNFASFCKMTIFERPGERVLVLLSSGSLAGTQAVISVLTQNVQTQAQAGAEAGTPSLLSAGTMFDVAGVVSDAMRAIEKRDKEHLERNDLAFNASFILGGQIRGEPMRLFRIYAEGNFIEAGAQVRKTDHGPGDRPLHQP
jgi:putative proteasome-type protease